MIFENSRNPIELIYSLSSFVDIFQQMIFAPFFVSIYQQPTFEILMKSTL